MLNSTVLVGRMTRDPELKKTNSGKSLVSFSLAVERDYAPDGAERVTDFIDCVAWGATADFISRYFGKGTLVCVKGRLEVNSFRDREGNNRKNTQVNVETAYFCESKKREGSSDDKRKSSGEAKPSSAQKNYFNEMDNGGDDLPF